MINFNQIEADIFIGSAPQSSVDIARLAQMKITAVLSLQSDEDLRSHCVDWKKIQSAYQYSKIAMQRFQIMDFDEVDMGDKLVLPIKALSEMLTQGHSVYVHCNAGVCRAPGTVLAYFCHYRGMTIEQGLEYIRRQRPQANPYIEAVKKALEQIAIQNKV